MDNCDLKIDSFTAYPGKIKSMTCKKHGQVTTWIKMGASYFCGECWAETMNQLEIEYKEEKK